MKLVYYTILLQDSLPPTNLPKDTISLKSDSLRRFEEQESLQITIDSTQESLTVKAKPNGEPIAKEHIKTKEEDIFSEIRQKTIHNTNQVKSDTQAIFDKTETQKTFHYFQSDKKQFQYTPQRVWQDVKASIITKSELNFKTHIYIRSQLNWTLFIGFFSVIILLGLKSNYRKFINQVINTMVNFQLADKLLREKNILVRRAFFMLNLNFLLIFSLFIMLLMNSLQVNFTEKLFVNYFIILGVVAGILLIRLILYYLAAFIFEWKPAINQQIHSSYLINKNIGLLLLPLVFAVIYTSSSISGILIYIGLGLILIASVFKLIRGFQIILRNGILLLYAFLYLCTLELLPWVIGSKLIIYLR